MDRKALAAAFPATAPVMLGYLSLGVAFGLLLHAAGYNALWALFFSVIVFAGSAQFLGVELLTTLAPLGQVAMMTFMLNFRHLVYGLSMLEKFRGMGGRKGYMIFALSDETYALLSGSRPPEGIDEKDYYFSIALLDQFYWVCGSVLGALLGAALPINTQGVDFAMTALFVVIAVEQWESAASHLPVFIGAGAALASLLLTGPERFLPPALAVIVLALLALRSKLDKEVSP